MRPYFNQNKFRISYNHNFEAVIRTCASINRSDQMGTWINEEMIEAYQELHQLGFAHSVEVWKEQKLVGGLYGIGLGKIFYGESMFAKANNASKFALISLCKCLENQGIEVIDCQQETSHLKSLGAEMATKESFWRIIMDNQVHADQTINLKG